jgi:hypothetical protein
MAVQEYSLAEVKCLKPGGGIKMFKKASFALAAGSVSNWAAAGVPYTVNWSPESMAVPVLSTPFLVAIAALLAVVVFRLTRKRPAAIRAGAVVLTAVTSGALIGGSAELRAGLLTGVPDCTGSQPGSACGAPFGNACGAPIVVTYSNVDAQNCGSLEGGLPAGSVLQDGDTEFLPRCSLEQCDIIIDPNNPQG